MLIIFEDFIYMQYRLLNGLKYGRYLIKPNIVLWMPYNTKHHVKFKVSWKSNKKLCLIGAVLYIR